MLGVRPLRPRLLGPCRPGGPALPPGGARLPDLRSRRRLERSGRLASPRRDSHRRRDLRRRVDVVGTHFRDHTARRCDGGPRRAGGRRERRFGASVPRRNREGPQSLPCARGRDAAARVGLRRVAVFVGAVRRLAIPADRRRGFVHRSTVVVRREEGARLGLARRDCRPHVPGPSGSAGGGVGVLLEVGKRSLRDQSRSIGGVRSGRAAATGVSSSNTQTRSTEARLAIQTCRPRSIGSSTPRPCT